MVKPKKAGTLEFQQGPSGAQYRAAIQNKEFTEECRFPGSLYKAERWLENKQKQLGSPMVGVPHPTHAIVREHHGDGTSDFLVVLFAKELWLTPKSRF